MEQLFTGRKTPSGKKPRVLVVDDDEDLLRLMQIKLKKEGFEVRISPNGENIFDVVESDMPDAVLLDLTMRGVEGAAICRQLKSNEKTQHIRVIVFSANHNISQITKECGADDYIAKPFNKVMVRETVAALLKRAV